MKSTSKASSCAVQMERLAQGEKHLEAGKVNGSSDASELNTRCTASCMSLLSLSQDGSNDRQIDMLQESPFFNDEMSNPEV